MGAEATGQAPALKSLSPGRRRLFFLLVVAFVLGLQEVCFRLTFPLPEVASFNRIRYTPLNLYGEELVQAQERGLSNVRIRWESEPDGFAFDHTLNLYGFRGPDFPVRPPADRPRVLFIGDSYTEGFGASDDDTIPRQFARALEDRSPVEAINLGVAGTGFPEYVWIMRDGVELLRPKAVFVIACSNDLPINDMARDPPPTPAFVPTNTAMPRAVAVGLRLGKKLAVPMRYHRGPFPFIDAVPSPQNPLTRPRADVAVPDNIDPSILDAMRRGKANPWLPGTGSAIESMLRHDFTNLGGGARGYLRRLATLRDRECMRLTVVYIPHPVVTNPLYIEAQNRLGGRGYGKLKSLPGPRYRTQQRHLEEACRLLKIPFLDTTDDFIKAEQTGRMFWPIDAHCNAAGYRLIAEICARHWVETAGEDQARAGAGRR